MKKAFILVQEFCSVPSLQLKDLLHCWTAGVLLTLSITIFLRFLLYSLSWIEPHFFNNVFF